MGTQGMAESWSPEPLVAVFSQCNSQACSNIASWPLVASVLSVTSYLPLQRGKAWPADGQEAIQGNHRTQEKWFLRGSCFIEAWLRPQVGNKLPATHSCSHWKIYSCLHVTNWHF